MTNYEIQVIHKPTGTTMSFEYEADEFLGSDEIIDDLEIIIIEPTPTAELHLVDL